MIYGTCTYKDEQCLVAVDSQGERCFLLSDFFNDSGKTRAKDLGIKHMGVAPKTMQEFISSYQDSYGDDMAIYFGTNYDLAIPLSEIQLLAPIPVPERNIICIGKNYIEHIAEINEALNPDDTYENSNNEIDESNSIKIKSPDFKNSAPYSKPIFFTKAVHTVIGPEDTIPAHSDITSQVDYEVELAVIIGKEGIDIKKEEAADHIFGFTIANDISARDLQNERHQWFKAKSLVGFCPMGPWIVDRHQLSNFDSLSIASYVNSEQRQSSDTSSMIHSVCEIIEDISRGFPLKPGDIILTGTPAGVGLGFNPPKFLKSGDVVTCTVEGIGTLENTFL